MKIKFYFSIVITISLLMLSTDCGLFSSGPGGTVKNFYNAIEDGKVDYAISLLSSRMVATMGEPKLRSSIYSVIVGCERAAIKSTSIMTTRACYSSARYISKLVSEPSPRYTDSKEYPFVFLKRRINSCMIYWL